MSPLVLGIGEYGACRPPEGVIKTYALGSCVAVVLLDPRTRCVGMIHIALPHASINPARALERPGYFADTGLPLLLQQMIQFGCLPRGQGMFVKLAGGASVMSINDTFNIGRRNVAAVRSILQGYGLKVIAEDVEGTISRTVSALASTGEVILSSPGRPDWKL